MVKNKLRELISKLVREEMMGEGTKTITVGKDTVTADEKDLGKIVGGYSSDQKSDKITVREMARSTEVFYSLKPNYIELLDKLKNNDDINKIVKDKKTKQPIIDEETGEPIRKISKVYQNLVDIVAVLKNTDGALSADEILKKHNENNPDRQYDKQQGFVRPALILLPQSGTITTDQLPTKSTQLSKQTSFEKAQNTITPSEKRGDKFGREVVDEPKPLKNPDFKLSDDQADIAKKMIIYKNDREAYRKADKPEEKQKYLDRLQSMASDPKMGKEIAQQYIDGYIATQDPATLSAYKKYKDEIQREASKRKVKPSYKHPTFSNRNQDVTIDNPEETEED